MIGKPATGAGGKGNATSPVSAADHGDDRFLHEIESLSRALALDPPKSQSNPPAAPPPSRRRTIPPSSSSSGDRRSLSAGRSHGSDPKPSKSSSSFREKKKPSSGGSSIWSWNPIKALSGIGHRRRFDCQFSFHVHSIEGLPVSLVGAAIAVNWRRTTDPSSSTAATRPVRVLHGGVAEFEETLFHRCSVSGTRSGHNRSSKYEPRQFLIYPSVSASVGGAVWGLDLGRHLVDLTRLLPLDIDELEEEDKGSGKWSTSFRLSGKAKGASLNMSFGFSLLRDGVAVESQSVEKKVSDILDSKEGRLGRVSRTDSMPQAGRRIQHRDRSRSVEDVKVLHEILPTSVSDVTVLSNFDREPEEDKYDISDSDGKQQLEVAAKLEESNGRNPHLLLEYVVDKIGSPELKPCSSSEPIKENVEKENDDPDFMVIEQGVEIESKAQLDESSSETLKEVQAESKLQIFNSERTESTGDKEKGLLCEEDEVSAKSDELEAPTSSSSSDLGESKLEDQVTAPTSSPSSDLGESKLLEAQMIAPTSSSSSDFEESKVLEDQVGNGLVSCFDKFSLCESEEISSPNVQANPSEEQRHSDVQCTYQNESKMGRSHSLDDVTESVASEFLNMLGIEYSPVGLSSDSDPESPREQLWKQFEKESLLSYGENIFSIDNGDGKESNWPNISDDFDLSLFVQEAEAELQKEALEIRNQSSAKMLEDAETEALMREWGLDEKTFQCSPPGSKCGFGSPIDLPPEEPPELPPLGEGLGSFLQTEDGGFLRSMSPTLFRNAKNNGNLVMQVSSPVVVPAEMGSGVMEILQSFASMGIEKLSIQANKLMPLEDINGKTLQQMSWEATPALDNSERHDSLQGHILDTQLNTSQGSSMKRSKGRGSSLSSSSGYGSDAGSEYVSLEDLAPLAMDKVEALSIEGLRIQSGMTDKEAPLNINSQSIGEFSTLQGKVAKNQSSLGLEGTAGLQLLDIKDNGEVVDGLMGCCITLDEWMRLDSGLIDDEDQISDRTSKILAAHHANPMELASGRWSGDKGGCKKSGKRWGFLGNNFTVALMVQLRDPLRNYEPVGTPMLSLVQVERVLVPPKPKIYGSVSEKGNSEQEDDLESEKKPLTKEEKSEVKDVIPQFKITEVHVAGLKTEPDKKKLWGNSTQQQSGSRWLLATGMGKSNKHPFLKSKEVAKPSSSQATTKVQPGDTLWSISSRVRGTGSKRNTNIRNPNVILPNETIRLR